MNDIIVLCKNRYAWEIFKDISKIPFIMYGRNECRTEDERYIGVFIENDSIDRIRGLRPRQVIVFRCPEFEWFINLYQAFREYPINFAVWNNNE